MTDTVRVVQETPTSYAVYVVYASGVLFIGTVRFFPDFNTWGFTTVDNRVYNAIETHEKAVEGLLKAVWGR